MKVTQLQVYEREVHVVNDISNYLFGGRSSAIGLHTTFFFPVWIASLCTDCVPLLLTPGGGRGTQVVCGLRSKRLVAAMFVCVRCTSSWTLSVGRHRTAVQHDGPSLMAGQEDDLPVHDVAISGVSRLAGTGCRATAAPTSSCGAWVVRLRGTFMFAAPSHNSHDICSVATSAW